MYIKATPVGDDDGDDYYEDEYSASTASPAAKDGPAHWAPHAGEPSKENYGDDDDDDYEDDGPATRPQSLP
jgi:hypothetical protein